MNSDEEKILEEMKKTAGYEWELVTRDQRLFRKLKKGVRPEIEEIVEDLEENATMRRRLVEGRLEMFEDLLED
jgi:hypothetical protein